MTTTIRQAKLAELEAGLEQVQRSPANGGVLEMIVRRPSPGGREGRGEADLDPADGRVGDPWARRGSRRTADGSAHPDMQINVMNARVAALVAQHRSRWALAGDQLFVDLDLSGPTRPSGPRLAMGSAVIKTPAEPHAGCGKFAE